MPLLASVGVAAAILVVAIPAFVWMSGRNSLPPDQPPEVALSDSNRAATSLPPLTQPEKRPSPVTAGKNTTPDNKLHSGDSSSATSSNDDPGEPRQELGTPTVSDLPIPVEDRQTVTFGPPGCPVVVIGARIWDIEKRSVRATLEGDYEEQSLKTLSPDGRYFAGTALAPHNRNNPICVWDTASGRTCLRIPGNPGQNTEFLQLAGDRIFLGGRSSNRMTIWSLSQAREERTLDLPDRNVKHANTAIARNGLYVAAIDKSKLVVIKIDTGETIVRMRAPKQMQTKENRGPKVPPGMVLVDEGGWIIDGNGGAADESECRSVYSSLEALEFSPDSRELAAISTHPQSRVICWNYQGRRLLDEPLYTEQDGGGENSITWFPGRKAWLLENDVFERESGKVVLSVRNASSNDPRVTVRDDDHLIGIFPQSPNELQVVKIPWKGILASLAELEKDAPALLSPAHPVSIVFELGPLRGDQNTTVRGLGDALKERLARDNLKVEKGQATFFRIRFSEKAGDSAAVFESRSPFDRDGRDTGQRVREAEGDLVVELVVPGYDEPVWHDSLSAASDTSYDGEVNELTVRDSMIENMANRMDELNFPYFIQKSEDLLALPVILQ